MRLFGSKETTKKATNRKPYRKPSEDEKDKQEARKNAREDREKGRKEDSDARVLFLERVKVDPELENQWISKRMGIEVKSLDPTQKKQQEIHSKIVDEAFKQIDENPELRREYTSNIIEKIVGEQSGKEEDYYGRDRGNYGYSDPLEALDVADKIKDRLGIKGEGGSGWSDLFKDPEVISGILEFVNGIKGGNAGGNGQPRQRPQQRIFVINVNGQPKQVNEADYQQLLESGQLQPVAELIEAHEETKPEEPTITNNTHLGAIPETTAETPALPAFMANVDLNAIAGYLDEDPEEFVIELKTGMEGGQTEQVFLWKFLESTTYDDIVILVAPYRENPQVRDAIDKLLSDEGKAWMDRVIELIQGEKV